MSYLLQSNKYIKTSWFKMVYVYDSARLDSSPDLCWAYSMQLSQLMGQLEAGLSWVVGSAGPLSPYKIFHAKFLYGTAFRASIPRG